MRQVVETPRSAAERPRIEVEDGVIEEARRRQRRRRRTGIVAAAVTALLAALLAPLFYAGGGGVAPRPPRHPASSLRPLTGPVLSDATHLTLAVSENGGGVFLVEVDGNRARAVRGLGIQPRQGPQVALSAHGSGVLATVTHWNCDMWVDCAKGQTSFPDRQSEFLITPSGSTRQLTTFTLARHQSTTPALDSASTWVLNWAHSGPCSLRLMPGSTAPVRVPCGSPWADTPGGLWISNGGVAMRVDPFTGRVRQRLRTQNELHLLPGDLALESAETAAGPSRLAVVNLASGARIPVRWPSRFRFGYQVFPAPNGPLVALEFGEPWYPQAHESINQAADLWILNTATGALTHVPGFPALELLKQSGVTWTADGRLVIAARVGGRTVLGVWKPGQRTLPIRSLPRLDGYSQFVALTR
jgi:hypothetical protein